MTTPPKPERTAEGRIRVIGVRCQKCDYDMKAAYQAAGGEADGEDWECGPQGVLFFNRLRCLRCEDGYCIAETVPVIVIEVTHD
jgi:hypothetical protein